MITGSLASTKQAPVQTENKELPMSECSTTGHTRCTTQLAQTPAGWLVQSRWSVVGSLLIGLFAATGVAAPTPEQPAVQSTENQPVPPAAITPAAMTPQPVETAAALPRELLQVAARNFESVLAELTAELTAALAPAGPLPVVTNSAPPNKTAMPVSQATPASKLPQTSEPALSQALHNLRLWSYSQPLPAPATKLAASKNANQPASQPNSAVTLGQLQQLHQLLQQLSRATPFSRNDETALRLQEQFAVLLYRYSPRSGLQSELASMLPILSRLLQQPALIGTDASPALAQQAAYRDLELYRALGFLLYAARNEPVQQQLWQQQQPLLQWLLTQVSHSSGWQLQHQLWALAYWQLLLADHATKSAANNSTSNATNSATNNTAKNSPAAKPNGKAATGLQPAQLDARVWQALLQNRSLSAASRQQLFSQHYLVNSFRTRESCLTDFANQCQLIEPDQVLTSSHDCAVDTHPKVDTHLAVDTHTKNRIVDSHTVTPQFSNTGTTTTSPALQIRIRHQGLNAAQLQQSCRLMLSQTSRFTDLLQSTAEPVANDHNLRLEVMIFPDYTAYNRDGSLAFDIQTNNGGMYIEGTPGDPANQARFFSFQQFWQAEPFAVWNLAHEFVHYLDGRFNLYGGFEHYPTKTVWWSEGLAEFISHTTSVPPQPAAATASADAHINEPNDKALQLLQDTDPSQFLTLSQIFATSYSEHGQDQIYRWSYWAWRFLATDNPALLRRLTSYLRGDFFKGYSDLLDEIAADKQAAFQLFLLRQRQLASTNPPKRADARPDWQPLGRYLYRSDLTPPELPASGKHFHLWQMPAVTQLNTQAGAKP